MKLARLVAVLVFAVAASPRAAAQPANIILIRHGEKPADKTDPNLNWFGKARAAALVSYFTSSPDMKPLGTPTVLFAQASPPGHSLRPYQTIKPYADSLTPPAAIDQKYESKEYAKLVTHVLADKDGLYKGKTLLICWEHDHLALMAAEFAKQLAAAGVTLTGAPKQWEWPGGEVFGRTWVFSFSSAKACAFTDFAQKLMYDDAKHDK
jgi:broad specificity phosphatase PhoE